MVKIGLENDLFNSIKISLPDGVVKARVMYLLKWYRKRAQQYKFFTYFGALASILVPALLVLLNNQALNRWLSDAWVNNLQIILPVLSSAGAAIYAFLQCKDNWIRYRTVIEQIKQETVCYIAQHENDGSTDVSAEVAFLKKVEGLCASELAEWRRNRMETPAMLNDEEGSMSSRSEIQKERNTP